MSEQHSPLPWSSFQDEIVDSAQTRVATVDGFKSEPDLQFLIKAVNSHEALVEALENAEFLLRKVGTNWKEAGRMHDSCLRGAEGAQAALKLAKGESQ